MLIVGMSGLAPKNLNMSEKESLKKLKYLNAARMPKLSIIFNESQILERLERSFFITNPERNVLVEVMIISPKNLQSHHP